MVLVPPKGTHDEPFQYCRQPVELLYTTIPPAGDAGLVPDTVGSCRPSVPLLVRSSMADVPGLLLPIPTRPVELPIYTGPVPLAAILVAAAPELLIFVVPSTVVVLAELPTVTVPVEVPVLMLVLKLDDALIDVAAPDIVAPAAPVSSPDEVIVPPLVVEMAPVVVIASLDVVGDSVLVVLFLLQ